jgi:hypothetical protein
VVRSEKFGEDARQQLEFSRGPDELVVDESTGVDFVFNLLEQERVLADLAKLHKLVRETRERIPFAAREPVRKRVFKINREGRTSWRSLQD